jgi:hypothetical protein
VISFTKVSSPEPINKHAVFSFSGNFDPWVLKDEDGNIFEGIDDLYKSE